jgi:uncharacterized protein
MVGGSMKTGPSPSVKCQPADVALRWVWNKPEISLVLSGMNTVEQVRENVASAERSGVDCLSAEEERLVSRVLAEYQRLSPIPCTKCGYCAPCPHGVDIPVNFELYNAGVVFQGSSLTLSKNLYGSLPDQQKATACEECAECEAKCPQQIPIREVLHKVQERLKQQ